MNNARYRSNAVYLSISPVSRLKTCMKSGNRIVVTAMSNISLWQFRLLSPPPHLMSLYSPESGVGMKEQGLVADLRRRRALKNRNEREKERKQPSLLRAGYRGWQAKAGLQMPFVKQVEKMRASSSLELRQCCICHPWGVSQWEREELVMVRGSLWALQMLKWEWFIRPSVLSGTWPLSQTRKSARRRQQGRSAGCCGLETS